MGREAVSSENIFLLRQFSNGIVLAKTKDEII
jgi:hypothetical protein